MTRLSDRDLGLETTRSKTKIIGLCGFKGAGKDSVGRVLCGGTVSDKTKTPIETVVFPATGVRQIALGDALRSVVQTLYGCSDEDFTDRGRKEQGPRRAMIGVAQKLRELDPVIWLRPVVRFMDSLGDEDQIVITDLRQPSEIQFVRMYGGEIWTVYSPRAGFDETALEAAGLYPDRADRVIWNGGTIGDLGRRVLDRALDRPSSAFVVVEDRERRGLDTLAVGRKEGADLWCAPGGKVETTDKTPAHAAAREMAEETGLVVDPADLVLCDVQATPHGKESWSYTVGWDRIEAQSRNHPILAALRAGRKVVNQEGQPVILTTHRFLSSPDLNPFATQYAHTVKALMHRRVFLNKT